jgi:hypothetical protein
MGLWLKCPGCQAQNPLSMQVCPSCGQELKQLPAAQRVYVIGPAAAAPKTASAAPKPAKAPAAPEPAPAAAPPQAEAPATEAAATPKPAKKAKKTRKKKG